MYILDSSCGWIPDAPIKFIYHLINLLKNLTPVVLIIMGSLDFGKAIMSQKEDQIKKAQGSFIKKIIAGAAVFFVVVFAKWVIKILDNAGVADSNKAFNCVSLLLTGEYAQNDKTYYEPPKTTTTKTTTESTNTRENCLEENATKIKECIDQNNGNTAANFHTYDSFWQGCMSSFDYENGDYGIACKNLEQCIIDNYKNDDVLCEELSESDIKNYTSCQTQFTSYKTYEIKYGPYTDDPLQQCHDYAQRKVNEEKNGSQSNDNIENYCKNLYCKN